jgi:hypothetical protein
MTEGNTMKWLQFGNIFTFVLMVVMNALANILPINGKETGEISDFYANLFAPAGVTFSIWGVIYLLLAAFVIYQLGWWNGGKMSPVARSVSPYFIISSIANAAWILCWHYDWLELSLVLMVIILLCLIAIHRITHAADLSRQDRFFVRLPFSVYFGWITVATIANVTTLLVSWKWDGFGIAESVWTVIVLLVGLLISGIIVYRYRNMAYGFVIVWAYLGIIIKHQTDRPLGFGGEYGGIILTASLSIAVMLILIINAGWQRRKASQG